jgi:hypothetical protein
VNPGEEHTAMTRPGDLTLAQLDRIGELRDHWSFLWDKRRSLWIAAEDCPDGEQFAELDDLLARLANPLERQVIESQTAAAFAAAGGSLTSDPDEG